MSVSSGALYRTGSVSVTQGDINVVGTGTSWLSAIIAIAVGDLFTLDMKTWYEVTSVNTDLSIDLDRGFEGATGAGVNYGIVRNTSGTVLTRIAGQIAVQFNQKQLFLDELRTWLNSTNASENITDSHGISTSITTPSKMEAEHASRVAQVDSLVGSVQAMTKAEFFALAEQRKRESAGSGFSEWGLANPSWNGSEVNSGIKTNLHLSTANQVNLGLTPAVNVNGVALKISSTIATDESSTVKLPTAPDGLDKADGTGRFTDLAAAIVAGGTGLTASVLSRQDFVFLESWHEKISDKDMVFPLGNVQVGATPWAMGIPNTQSGNGYKNTSTFQGYSAFGEWDDATIGLGVVWSAMDETQRAAIIQDPDNNIYSDDGELIQVRYRVRVIKGLGNEWTNTEPNDISAANNFGFSGGSHINSRGSLVDVVDYRSSSSINSTFRKSDSTYSFNAENGLVQTKWSSATELRVSAMPIALVQRRNQGIYHPSFNSDGCSAARNTTNTGNALWHQSNVTVMTSTSSCFDLALNPEYTRAKIGTAYPKGRPDTKFYDAIYASDVQDLRMSSQRVPKAELREKYNRMAIAGEVRGFEGAPFSKTFANAATSSGTTEWVKIPFAQLTGDTTNYSNDVNNNLHTGIMLHSSGGSFKINRVYRTSTEIWLLYQTGYSLPTGGTWSVVFGDKQTHKQANPTWTGIVGDPANIAATLPDGVEGQWIPDLSAGVIARKLNRKNTTGSALSGVYTNNLGSTWIATTWGASTINNTITTALDQCILVNYETQAHFTQDAVGITQLTDWSPVYATNNKTEALLTSSLVNKVATGTDPSEQLAITKIISEVISHTPETLTPVVKYSTAIGVKDGVAYLMFNCDDTGVIDGSNIKATALPYFISEE